MDRSGKGTLYIVATPIGNLKDITYRAVDTLKSVAFVLAEDTRYSKKLFNRYGINTQLVSYRDQNHNRMIDKVVEKLDMGLDLALISDSGTPLVSDPGYKLVHDLREKGYAISPIPGPSALTAAISVSGLPSDRILFLGFLPKSSKKQQEALRLADDTQSTLVVYESPNRLVGLLENISNILGTDRKIAVCSELTKMYESVTYGTVEDVIDILEKDGVKGEYVVCIGKK